MKGSINARLVLGLGLLAFAGAGTVSAAERLGDAQEQARLLLTGQSVSARDRESRSVSQPGTAAGLDAQEQGREMILGRPFARTSAAGADALGSRAAGGPDDALEMARRMILGSRPQGHSPKARLAGKAAS